MADIWAWRNLSNNSEVAQQFEESASAAIVAPFTGSYRDVVQSIDQARLYVTDLNPATFTRLRSLDAETGAQQWETGGTNISYRSVAVSPDGAKLYAIRQQFITSGIDDGHGWGTANHSDFYLDDINPDTGAVSSSLMIATAHSGVVSLDYQFADFDISPDGTKAYIPFSFYQYSSLTPRAQIVDLVNMTCADIMLSITAGHLFTGLAASPDGLYIWGLTTDRMIRKYDATTGALISSFTVPSVAPGTQSNTILVSSDGLRIYARFALEVVVYDVANNSVLRRVALPYTLNNTSVAGAINWYALPVLIIGTLIDETNSLYSAVKDPNNATNVQIYRFKDGTVASKETLANIANAKSPSIRKGRGGVKYLTATKTDGTSADWKSDDNFKTVVAL